MVGAEGGAGPADQDIAEDQVDAGAPRAAGDQGQSEEQEEAVRQRPLLHPDMPSASEVAHHKTTHCPYRCWCDECVEAFGREWPHRSAQSGRSRCIPVIHMDYAFLTDQEGRDDRG